MSPGRCALIQFVPSPCCVAGCRWLSPCACGHLGSLYNVHSGFYNIFFPGVILHRSFLPFSDHFFETQIYHTRAICCCQITSRWVVNQGGYCTFHLNNLTWTSDIIQWLSAKLSFPIMAQLQSHTEISNSILYYRVSQKKGTNRTAQAMVLRLNHL